jgi:flagellar hook-associated protein FlgK
MLQRLTISRSGLRFAQQHLRSTAHNTANATTAERSSLRVRGRQAPEGGVRIEVELGQTRQRVEDAVEMIAAEQHFAAGVRAVQTQDNMLGALLDIEG